MDRKEISLLYSFEQGWIAGFYYIENIIQSLNTLPDSQKPFVKIFCKKQENFDIFYKLTKYPYLEYEFYNPTRSFFKKILNRSGFAKLDIGKSIFIFPYENTYEISDTTKILSWIPDFQEKHYPEYFSTQDLRQREIKIKKYIRNNRKIVFSSLDAEKDFDKFYPKNKNNRFVLRFAVTHPDFSHIKIENLRDKFKFDGSYYFCANQFWQHKNHKLLFNAIKILKENGKNPTLLCSGSPKDYRNPGYFPMLENFIKENNLSENIKILGFIDRLEQLCLMKNSIAVIQPSLFEGWSTTVEDCKALSKFIFLSDLNVHLEQIKENVCFFDKNSASDLANKLQNAHINEIKINYSENVKKFGEDFLEIIQKMESV